MQCVAQQPVVAITTCYLSSCCCRCGAFDFWVCVSAVLLAMFCVLYDVNGSVGKLSLLLEQLPSFCV